METHWVWLRGPVWTKLNKGHVCWAPVGHLSTSSPGTPEQGIGAKCPLAQGSTHGAFITGELKTGPLPRHGSRQLSGDFESNHSKDFQGELHTRPEPGTLGGPWFPCLQRRACHTGSFTRIERAHGQTMTVQEQTSRPH